jgi:hypothetical protein
LNLKGALLCFPIHSNDAKPGAITADGMPKGIVTEIHQV